MKINTIALAIGALLVVNATFAERYQADYYNYTSSPIDWHMRTSDKKGKYKQGTIPAASWQEVRTRSLDTGEIVTERRIVPGHAHFKTKMDGELLKNTTLTRDGKTIKYTIPALQAGKHWSFVIEGKSSKNRSTNKISSPWSVCGWYKTTKQQRDVAIGGTVIGGAASGALVAQFAGGTIVGSALGIAMGVAPKSFGLDQKLKKDKCIRSK